MQEYMRIWATCTARRSGFDLIQLTTTFIICNPTMKKLSQLITVKKRYCIIQMYPDKE